MSRYVLNLNQQDSSNGSNYEVHKISVCPTPPVNNYREVGDHSTCKAAILNAKLKFPSISHLIDGCKHCTSCHKE